MQDEMSVSQSIIGQTIKVEDVESPSPVKKSPLSPQTPKFKGDKKKEAVVSASEGRIGELKSSQLKLEAIQINSIQPMDEPEDDPDDNIDREETPPKIPIRRETEDFNENRNSVELGNILNDVSSISGYIGAETPSVP